MPSLRSPLSRLSARLLIAALVFASLPAELLAARQLPPRLLTSLPVPAAASGRVDPLHGPIHADGIGSIRRLTDEAGNITDGYTYSAFGELLAHTGSDPQPYAFTGEPLDSNSSFQYHRARWMDPRAGRFTAMDPWVGRALEPTSLHRYLYADADPLDKRDPTGRFASVGGALTTGVGLVTIVAIAVVVAAAVYEVFRSGVTPLTEFDIDTYASFNTRDRRRDPFIGHEILQNAWLITHGFTRARNSGVASRENPAIAVRKHVHDRINALQRQRQLYNDAVLLGMDGETNIAINSEITIEAGVWPWAVVALVIAAQAHLERIKGMRARGEATW